VTNQSRESAPRNTENFWLIAYTLTICYDLGQFVFIIFLVFHDLLKLPQGEQFCLIKNAVYRNFITISHL
jgi:hypothetical protein